MVKLGDIVLTEEYWDCECEHLYIHPKIDVYCKICGADRDECPDSRVNEVLARGYTIAESR